MRYIVEVTTAYEVEAKGEDDAFSLVSNAFARVDEVSHLQEWHEAADNWQEVTAVYPKED
jgi:hypothetical protein